MAGKDSSSPAATKAVGLMLDPGRPHRLPKARVNEEMET